MKKEKQNKTKQLGWRDFLRSMIYVLILLPLANATSLYFHPASLPNFPQSLPSQGNERIRPLQVLLVCLVCVFAIRVEAVGLSSIYVVLSQNLRHLDLW